MLVVDDDVRNIFAITAALERHEMRASCSPRTARTGLEISSSSADVDVVLMDIMMPEMDGYEAIRRIRQNAKVEQLPIIAADRQGDAGDREKCIQAGASDYIAKPVEMAQLLSLLRVRLSGGR